jgi:hypothetical protein
MTDDSVSGYLARGWSVVALHGVINGACTCGSTEPDHGAGKHPLYRNWPKIPIRELGVWQHVAARGQPTNVGLATGRTSGVFALDFDPKNVLDQAAVFAIINALPATWSQRTGSGGMHWLFRMPDDFEPTNRTGLLPKGLDIRGTGGQIVIAPSVTDKGAYAILRGVEPLGAPAQLLDAIRPPAYEPRPAPSDQQPGPQLDKRTAAYAGTARDAVLKQLREESSTRNEQAYRTACRLHELINAGWLDYDDTYDAYLEACEQASGNKPEPFGQVEANQVWTNAAHRTAAEVATLPPSMMGGTRLDFPGTLEAPGSSTDPGTPSSLPYFANPGEVPQTSSATSNLTDQGLNLPPEFWASRPVLKHIQMAAHSRLVSADVLLHSILVRLSALWPHEVRLDTGVATPASANLTVAVIGPSGAGKTSGIGLARRILPAPGWLDRETFADDRPLGSGEGMSEVYMGYRRVPIEQPPDDPLTPGPAKVKLEKVRMQVRHNALLHADEGEALAKMMERQGATVAVELRRAWSGGTIGQSNGTKETTRVVEEGRYSMGLIIGFQLNTVQQLLASVEAGTVQRFLFCWALDPSVPRERLPDPGALQGIWPPAVPLEGSLVNPGPEVDLRKVTFSPAILDEIWEARFGRVTTMPETMEDLTSHRSVTLVKLSALLAYLDCGRRNVTDEDWRLAGMVWDASCRVRDYAIETGRQAAGKAVRDRSAAHSAQELAVDEARAARERQHVEERVALAVTRLVQQYGPQTAGAIRRRSYSPDRPRVADALILAVERGWLAERGTLYAQGETHV